VVGRYATSPRRAKILRGLLNYRQALLGLGFVSGFQWLNGSFTEDLPTPREPVDIDVVSFMRRPAAASDDVAFRVLVMANPWLVDSQRTKAAYDCDAYSIDLSNPPETLVDDTNYWLAVFAHRRTGEWKGLVHVKLNTPADETRAGGILTLRGY
jgi:hypothetical protein